LRNYFCDISDKSVSYPTAYDVSAQLQGILMTRNKISFGVWR